MTELREQHEDLYGALLAANQGIEDAGTGWLMVAAVVTTLSVILGLQVAWIDDVVGRDLSEIRNWGTYVGFLVAGFFTFGATVNLAEWIVYRRSRGEIHSEARRAGIGWNALLSRTSADETLEHVGKHLRKDRAGRHVVGA